jgi:hypothetical protein
MRRFIENGRARSFVRHAMRSVAASTRAFVCSRPQSEHIAMTVTPFTLADVDHAHKEWGVNCGPCALAAIISMTLEEVRQHMGDFERKHYTNPSLMIAALRSTRAVYKIAKLGDRAAGAVCTFLGFPRYGLARVQWEGPWTKPGVPMRARYRYTHWVGAASDGPDIGIFDINCMNNGTGWCSLDDWRDVVVPYILQQYPRASGQWHITHQIEIEHGANVARQVLSFPGDLDLELTALTSTDQGNI